MFASDDNGWNAYDLTMGFSSIYGKTNDAISKLIRAYMNQETLSKDDIDLILYACWHSTINIDDEEILKWHKKYLETA